MRGSGERDRRVSAFAPEATVWVGEIPKADEQQLRETFERFGLVLSASVHKGKKRSGRSWGLVTFARARVDAAERALQEEVTIGDGAPLAVRPYDEGKETRSGSEEANEVLLTMKAKHQQDAQNHARDQLAKAALEVGAVTRDLAIRSLWLMTWLWMLFIFLLPATIMANAEDDYSARIGAYVFIFFLNFHKVL